jgi:diguanylate cyclase (GGDEF)-like protein
LSRRALIADPSGPVSAALRTFLEAAGFSVKVVRVVDEALLGVKASEPDVLFASSSPLFDGEALCQQVKALYPLCPVVLVYAPEVEDPDSAAMKAGADACLVGPLKRGTVVSCAKAMLRIRDLRQTVEKLEGDLKRHIAEPPADPFENAGTSADFDFFRRLLLMEVKRSRRYKYPVSFLLVALDHYEQRVHDLSAEARTAVQAEALSILTRCVRDIDLAILFSESRFLLFLPHTPREGAMVVAGRALERIRTKMEGMTLSVGIASYEPHPDQSVVKFGALIKSATDALQRAQAAGGDQIELAGGKSKRSRIVLG